jgi:hypothetical protein
MNETMNTNKTPFWTSCGTRLPGTLRAFLVAVGVLGGMVPSLQSQPADQVQGTSMNKQTCLESGMNLDQMIEAWRGTNEIKNLENIMGLCEAIRRASLSVPECREVYLRAVQFILDVPSAGDAEQLTTILKLQQTASRMLRGDDVAAIPASERAAFRAEVMRKHALFVKRMRQELADARQAGPFYINVAPPPNLGQPGFAGMNPDAIKDPVKRQEYLDAIKANASRKDASRKQARLNAALADEQRQIESYVVRNYPATPDAKKEVQQFLELGGFEKQEVQSVLKRISAKGNTTDQ